ncbi:hypothetical protein WJX73_007811 [Symbiochloris irregularis]|uniref:tRNA:m(4)X modification enzyme TRM13 n=1 Tax=Symbiochloris irregularis TaxID=706552 RepID=A0AAW1PTW8_9CHLO
MTTSDSPQLQCQHYLPKKRRNCNFLANTGEQYCGNHLILHAPGAAADRRACPYDSNHIVWSKDLQRHIERCPTRVQQLKKEGQPWHCAGCNARVPPSTGAAVVSEPSANHDVLQIILKLRVLLEQVQPPGGRTAVLLPAECKNLMQPSFERPSDAKHLRQQASIVGHMQAAGLLQGGDDSTPVYMELGSGKGYLTDMAAAAFRIRLALLLDTGSFRHKADRTLRKVKGLEFVRVRTDLQDFCPPLHPMLAGDNASRPWVGMGKHLCGAATDFALRLCMQRCHQGLEGSGVSTLDGCSRQSQQSNTQESRCRGLAIAPCCHHRCTWEHYVNQAWMVQQGIGPSEFAVLCWMTGWAVCKPGRSSTCAQASNPPSSASPEGSLPGLSTEPEGFQAEGVRLSAFGTGIVPTLWYEVMEANAALFGGLQVKRQLGRVPFEMGILC